MKTPIFHHLSFHLLLKTKKRKRRFHERPRHHLVSVVATVVVAMSPLTLHPPLESPVVGFTAIIVSPHQRIHSKKMGRSILSGLQIDFFCTVVLIRLTSRNINATYMADMQLASPPLIKLLLSALLFSSPSIVIFDRNSGDNTESIGYIFNPQS